LEYIQSLRVQKAKERLATESVKDIAKPVGFWDAQALIRVFKKYEGITPGQYKDLLQKK
jgi:AraC-like DNA-binding protein